MDIDDLFFTGCFLWEWNIWVLANLKKKLNHRQRSSRDSRWKKIRHFTSEFHLCDRFGNWKNRNEWSAYKIWDVKIVKRYILVRNDEKTFFRLFSLGYRNECRFFFSFMTCFGTFLINTFLMKHFLIKHFLMNTFVLIIDHNTRRFSWDKEWQISKSNEGSFGTPWSGHAV